MEGIRLLLPFSKPQTWPPPSPHWFPGPTELEVSTAEFLDSIGLALHLHPLYSFIVFLYLTPSENLQGTSQEQGPFLALGRVKGQTGRFSSYFFPRKQNSNWNHMSGFSELQRKARTGSPAAGSLLPPCQLGFTFSLNEKLEVHPVLCKNSLLVMDGVARCPGIHVCVRRYMCIYMYMHICVCVCKLCKHL